MAQNFLPLVLISQIQRSGGSMLSQLLDGHPELLAHPYEIYIGWPNKWDWPNFSLTESPEDWFAFLHESQFDQFAAAGYSKPGRNAFSWNQVFPFRFSPSELRSRFRAYCTEATPVRSQRQVLDAYFRAFFDSWEDHRPTGSERYVAGFTPRVVMYPPCVDRFFTDYPDGKLISIVRDPASWFASTVRHNSAHGNVRRALRDWIASAQGIARVAGRENVLVLIYEDVLRRPEVSMRRVADFIGIAFDDILLTPTYLRQPIIPNSSFDVDSYGINREMIDRRNTLPAETVRTIDEKAQPLYQEFVERYGLPAVA